MTFFLATFSSDWADEFTAEGLAILSAEEVEALKLWAVSEPEWYFGTNEFFEGEDLTDCFTFKEITSEEVATLERLIPDLVRKSSGTFNYGGKFGQFPKGVQ